VKKVQDHYFHKAKKENYPARSVYKLEEAQKRYGLLKKGDTVLDLGCHPGSWSLYAAKVVGVGGLVVGVDLQSGKPLVAGGGARITKLCGDICDPETIARLQTERRQYRVLLSDMAPATTGNKWADAQKSLELARLVLQLAAKLLEPAGNFYCKVFEGEDFKEYVDTVRRMFDTVRIVKPKSSRSESPEVFVLGLGYRCAAPEVEDQQEIGR